MPSTTMPLTAKGLRKEQGGFTLIEVVIAMAIIAIALLQIVSVVVHTVRMKESEREHQLALRATQTKLEEIKKTSFTTMLTTYNNQVFSVAGLVKTSIPAGPGNLGRGTVAIDATNTNLLDITVTIEWDGVDGPQLSSMRSLYTR